MKRRWKCIEIFVDKINDFETTLTDRDFWAKSYTSHKGDSASLKH